MKPAILSLLGCALVCAHLLPAQECVRPFDTISTSMVPGTLAIIATPRERLDPPMGSMTAVATQRLAYAAYTTATGVDVRRSTDGGLSWEAPETVWTDVGNARLEALVATEHAVFAFVSDETDAAGLPVADQTMLWCIASEEQGVAGSFQQTLVSTGVTAPLASGDLLELDRARMDVQACAGAGRAHVLFLAGYAAAAGLAGSPSSAQSPYLASVEFVGGTLATVQAEPSRTSTFATGTADATQPALACDGLVVATAWRDDRIAADDRRTRSRTSTDGGTSLQNEIDHADSVIGMPAPSVQLPGLAVDGSTVVVTSLLGTLLSGDLVAHVSTDSGATFTNNVFLESTVRQARPMADGGVIAVVYELDGANPLQSGGLFVRRAPSAADLIAGTTTDQNLLPGGSFLQRTVDEATMLDETAVLAVRGVGSQQLVMTSTDAAQSFTTCVFDDPSVMPSPLFTAGFDVALTGRGDVVSVVSELFATTTTTRAFTGGRRVPAVRFEAGAYVVDGGSSAYGGNLTVLLVSTAPPSFAMGLANPVDGFLTDFVESAITIPLVTTPGFVANADAVGGATFPFGISLGTFFQFPFTVAAVQFDAQGRLTRFTDAFVDAP
jgi:hypothetical protein